MKLAAAPRQEGRSRNSPRHWGSEPFFFLSPPPPPPYHPIPPSLLIGTYFCRWMGNPLPLDSPSFLEIFFLIIVLVSGSLSSPPPLLIFHLGAGKKKKHCFVFYGNRKKGGDGGGWGGKEKEKAACVRAGVRMERSRMSRGACQISLCWCAGMNPARSSSPSTF